VTVDILSNTYYVLIACIYTSTCPVQIGTREGVRDVGKNATTFCETEDNVDGKSYHYNNRCEVHVSVGA
jgi:hypothetical protein